MGDDITPFIMTFTVPAVGRMTALREKIARGVKAGKGVTIALTLKNYDFIDALRKYD
jgi:hypothetical protein